MYPQGIAEMAEFLGDPVAHINIERFPFADAAFDVVIVIVSAAVPLQPAPVFAGR